MIDSTPTTVIDPTTAPIPTEEREPMLLLDVTGSMNRPASLGGSSRNAILQESIFNVVSTLAQEDSQAANEAGGGLRAITFADGKATDIGDLNPTNLRAKWRSIRWSGGTYIMPGFHKMQQVYAEEFGKEPVESRPKLLALVITDGEAEDTDTFARTLAQIGGGMYTVIAIVGYGTEHDQALASYQAVAAQNTHVKVVSLEAQTDPQVIADTLLRMIA